MNDLVNKIKALVKQDPTRAGVLGVLTVVLVVMVLRATVGGSTSPSAALASIGANLTEARPTVESAQAVVASDSAGLQKWLSEPIALSDRNLFAVRYERFPRDGSRASENAVAAPDGFWEDLAKSMTSQADQIKRRQYLIENVRRQAASLKLQSTLMRGQTPKALINGEQVGEGDVVLSAPVDAHAMETGDARVEFRVLKIEARRIIVEREGIRLEIQMN